MALFQADQAGMSPNSREGAIDDFARSIDGLRADAARLPGSEALAARIEAVARAFEADIGGAEAAAQLASLREYWQRDSADTTGWEAEQAIATPAPVRARPMPSACRRRSSASSWRTTSLPRRASAASRRRGLPNWRRSATPLARN
ncbi:MAG: hypothetical protein IPK27_14990 [Rhodanobacteraceae bacterium]|nr:hypothetical protein [Rhodanobacteraceae bacterium]